MKSKQLSYHKSKNNAKIKNQDHEDVKNSSTAAKVPYLKRPEVNQNPRSSHIFNVDIVTSTFAHAREFSQVSSMVNLNQTPGLSDQLKNGADLESGEKMVKLTANLDSHGRFKSKNNSFDGV